jgi:quercetin dioxygenase-like cupin family protein
MRVLVPPLADSALALSAVELDSAAPLEIGEPESDVLLYTFGGAGSLRLGGRSFELEPDTAALVLAGEEAVLEGEGLAVLRATAGPSTDRHAALGRRETVTRLDREHSETATGSRFFQILLGPGNGSQRATLFAGFVPPGRAPWHYHLYDEIVWIPEGPGRLHRVGSEEALHAGSAFRLRPREVHIVENSSADRPMTVIGFFTPAGSPSAAYLPES